MTTTHHSVTDQPKWVVLVCALLGIYGFTVLAGFVGTLILQTKEDPLWVVTLSAFSGAAALVAAAWLWRRNRHAHWAFGVWLATCVALTASSTNFLTDAELLPATLIGLLLLGLCCLGVRRYVRRGSSVGS